MSWDDDRTVMGLLADDLERILKDLDYWAESVEVFDSDEYQALAQRLWNVMDTLRKQGESK